MVINVFWFPDLEKYPTNFGMLLHHQMITQMLAASETSKVHVVIVLIHAYRSDSTVMKGIVAKSPLGGKCDGRPAPALTLCGWR